MALDKLCEKSNPVGFVKLNRESCYKLAGTSSQAPYPSPLRERRDSLISLLLLFPTKLRFAGPPSAFSVSVFPLGGSVFGKKNLLPDKALLASVIMLNAVVIIQDF